MDTDRNIRLKHLLDRQKARVKMEYAPLFDECIEALGEGVTVYSLEKSKELYQQFQEQVPFTSYRRVDWSKFSNYELVLDLKELGEKFENYLIQVYWSFGEFPVIETTLEKIIKAYDDVIAVSADTYLYVSNKFVIEIFHEGEITIGFL